MSYIPPSKEWMDAPRLSDAYIDGIRYFIQFVRDNLGDNDCFCPCKKCRNYKKLSLKQISEDLLLNGVDKSYRIWVNHGEPPPRMSPNIQVPSSSTRDHSESAFPRMMGLFNDTFGHVHPNDLDVMLNELDQQDDAHVQDTPQVDRNYKKNVEDALQPLYPNCDGQHTKLSAVVELLSMKARHQCSEALVTELLQFIKKILPDGSTLPENCQKAKAMIKPFADMDSTSAADAKIVFGSDKKGHVRGMRGGVKKTQMLASAPSREILRKLEQENKSFQSDIELLKSQLGTLVQKCASSSSSNQAPDDSTLPASSCFLKSFRGKTIGIGSYNTVVAPMEHTYSVIVEEIFDKNAELYDEEGTLGDVMIGQVINWPKPSVKSFRQLTMSL